MLKSYRLLFTFLILSGFYLLSQFYRVSNAVIAPNLISDLRLNAETLGILGGAFFYSFALCQIPMGPLLDRLGPRSVICYSAMVTAVGAFLFAIGGSFVTALVGRILIGLGMASVLMGSMKVFILQFPPERFATLSGLLLSVGTLGNILATSPLAYLTSTVGWRASFVIFGGGTLAFSFLGLWILADKRERTRPGDPAPKEALGILQSMKTVVTSLSLWQIGILGFFRYGTFVGLQGLWLGPFLIDAQGYTPVEAGNVLILFAVGAIVGGPLAGRLSDHVFRSRKAVTFFGVCLYCLSLIPLTGIVKIRDPLWFGALFFLIGMFGSFGLLVFSHAKDLFPVAISGTVITFVNFFTMAGGALFMPVLGRVIESFPRTGNSYPPEAYHLAFFVCVVGMAASLIFYAFSKPK